MKHYIVRCSSCGKTQKYYCYINPKNKKKQCVYCGKVFTIYKTQEDNQLVLGRHWRW